MKRNQIPLKADDVQGRLHRKWWAAVLICLSTVSGGFLFLTYGWPKQYAVQWILQAAPVTAFVLYLLRVGLPLNYHPRHKILYPAIGLGTWITVLRGMLIAMLAGYLFQPWPGSRIVPTRLSWAPGAIYTVASILDYLDGRVARARQHQTRLGEYLDVNIDALGLLIAPLLAVWYGQLPIAYLSVGAAYYVFIFAIRLRKKFEKPVFTLKPWTGARIIAGFQMGLVSVALLPLFSPPATTITGYIFMIPLLAGFARDWFIVCGYIKSDSSLLTDRVPRLKSFFTR